MRFEYHMWSYSRGLDSEEHTCTFSSMGEIRAGEVCVGKLILLVCEIEFTLVEMQSKTIKR